MKKIILFAGICFGMGFFNNLSAQKLYNTAIGLRAGLPFGLTVKHYVGGNDNALEGIAHANDDGFGVTGLFEHHEALGDIEGLAVYYGVGAGFFLTDGKYKTFNLGIDGIIGVEYKFIEIPISVGLDFKPYANIIPEWRLNNSTMQGALSVRYAF